MTDASNPGERLGWELIWRAAPEHPKYGTFASPSPSVVEWADTLPQGGYILDIGCGVGRHLIYLGERGFRVAGVDISPTGIKTSQEACASRQIAFDGHVADMHTLPWADNTFDGAFSISTIHHGLRADIIRTLKEIRRILKPGGLVLLDFASTETIVSKKSHEAVARGELTEVEPNTFVDERPQIDEMADEFLPHHYSDEAELHDFMSSFEIVRLWADLREVPPEHGSGKTGRWVVWAKKPMNE